MRHRRTILKVLCLLAAGAAFNVAVAWGLAVWVPLRFLDHVELFDDRTPADVFVAKSFGSEYAWIRVWLPDGRAPRFMLPIQVRRERGLADPAGIADEHYRAGVERRGWPFLGMCWWHTPALHVDALRAGGGTFRPDAAPTVVRGIELPSIHKQINLEISTSAAARIPRRSGVSSRVLPLHPLWPGFAVNTLFYAGALWVMFCGPFMLRRMIRRRRGRCPGCAYPVGRSPVCTECGAAVIRHAAI